MDKPLLAFHGDPKIKQKYLERVRAHREADQIVKGSYWQNGKGCAVGCTIHGSEHNRYEKELGISVRLALMEDSIFEGLPNDEAMMFPERFLEAIPVGADLSKVIPKFCLWLMQDKKQGVMQYADINGKKAIKMVIAVLKADCSKTPATDEARSAAESAARSAAWSAARSAAESAARSAAWSAAESAARSAAESAAWSAAESAQSKKLLEILSKAPVPTSKK